jgi:hypothetical protein
MTRTGGSFHVGAASTGKSLPCKLLIKPASVCVLTACQLSSKLRASLKTSSAAGFFHVAV